MGHAILSPSASHRWIMCPASVRMTRDLPPQEESVYAREGTQFHTLCELSAKFMFLGGSQLEYEQEFLEWALETEEEWRSDQMGYLQEYLLFLEKALDEEPGARLLLEQQVDTGIPGCWGTADVVIISEDRIRVIDIKYGAGVRVSAIENTQLMSYGVGALSLVDDPLRIREVTVSVWQPRMNNVSDYTLPRTDLIEWRDGVIPVAKLALGEDAPFGPSESACRWCPIAGECAARTRKMLAEDFGDPDLLSGGEMAEAYSRTSELKKWASDIEDAALKRAYEQEGSVPGFKVVRSGGRRTITDADKAVDILLAAEYEPSQVFTRKPATLAKLEKLVGSADKLQQVLGDLLVRTEGRLSLVLESDHRPAADAVHSAKTDFADITE